MAMTSDRRAPRIAVNRIIPLQIEGLPAVILDSSEAGLRFRSLRPLTQSGALRFSVGDDGQRIDATGELIWLDAEKQTGGLSLAPLPAATRERIHNWILSAAADQSAPSVLPRPAGTHVFQPLAPQPSAPYAPPLGLPMPSAGGPSYVMFEDPEYIEKPRTRFFSGFLTGVCLSAMAALILFFALGGSSRTLFAPWGAGSAATSQAQTALPPPPVSAPAVTPAPDSEGSEPSVVSHPAAAGPQEAAEVAVATEAAVVSPPPASAVTSTAQPGGAPEPAAAAVPGAIELERAQRYLSRAGGTQAASAEAVPLLWSAVEKGNTAALVTLAGLYARGDGVARNCIQARVLLRAAAEKGDRDASQRLAQVVRNGCG